MFRTSSSSALRAALVRGTTRKVLAKRFNSSSAGTSKSGNGRFLTLGLLAVAGTSGGYYLYSQRNSAGEQLGVTDSIKAASQPHDYQTVYDEIVHLLDSDDYDDGSFGPVLVRLAWHCSGTFDAATGTGGSNGATMRFAPEGDHGANAGLHVARERLEAVRNKHPWISFSDLWTLAGVAAIQEMSGGECVVPWRPGRQDRDVAFCTPDGRLPDASLDQGHLRNIFYRMGFNDQEIVALSGAHALGRCHTDRSGFSGPWTFSPTVLTNDYYKLLLEERWSYKPWQGPKQFEDVSTKSLMMLPTDMALIKDKKLKPHVEAYAKDSNLFMNDFSKVFVKLLELGVPFAEDAKPIELKVHATA
ncbi:Cytochrome c peroxidase,mitochondrial [Taphrina deformans PYCC 5710]|uniref:Peroxidase n=1 Tax=Taphrina deformans (strain PYCC 5710 / ATCC 11124 / CBS 356.35 / IMI 108563 / JCM 9778 / NBRC 8474) TaxID=1097556 RepID=R4XAK1_TAPDE|nr:Cytochrome c peroxidase,mitochondrial [Taphrina deformans PYCC 5710]|eukprot:CCG82859.1 Cytochrome c peroxidase,mitochondrial [Taphrina deformans PYCC 5710]